MLFFKVEGKHNIALDADSAARQNRLGKISLSYKKYNNAHQDAFYFVADVSDEDIVAAFVVFDESANADYKKFPWDVGGIDILSETTTEITSYIFGSLLDMAIQNDMLENFRSIKILRNKLSLFSHNYREGILSDENFYNEDIADDTNDIGAFKKRANDYLWCDALSEEYDRIASMPALGKFMGHPVHYLFASDNYDEREMQAKNLISALYACGRLKSRRYCSISVSSVYNQDLHNISALYDCYNGGTIMLRFRRSARQESDWSDVPADVICRITSLIKRHSNKVLTILCFPLSCEKEKDLFYPELTSESFVEFNDDAVDCERAKEYLMRKAENNGAEADDGLFCAIDARRTYRAEELDRVYDDWYSDMLREKLYPAYSHCARVGASVLKEGSRGNSYGELMDMIGLTEAKTVIKRAIDYYRAQKAFADMGFSKDRPSMHMVFTGNPGTAKTTVARLFASIMRENEILSSGHLIEVGRGDIVGKYVGSTAPLVKAVFRKAKGGVLFIDEAYSLVDDKDGLYGDEAINTIVQEMENNREDTCVIFAGYPDKMEKFLDKNPGLRSRIAFHVPFSDYSEAELMEITRYMGRNNGVTFDDGAMSKLKSIYAAARDAADFGNGRFVRNMLEKARMAQAARLISLGFDNVTSDIVKTITADDIDDFVSKSKHQSRIGFAAG